MSEAKLIGSRGIRFTEDQKEGGPRANLDERNEALGDVFTIERGNDEYPTSMSRAEVRDLLPLLIAFADGAP